MSLPPPAPAERPTPAFRLGGWRLALTLALTVALLVLLFTQVRFSDIVTMLRRADPRLFALGCAAYVVSYLGRVARWQLLTPSRSIPKGALFGITSVHNFMLRALPSKLGEGVYLVLMRAQGVSGTEALAGLVIARLYDMAAAIVFFLISLLLTGAQLHQSLPANLAAGAAVVAFCALAVLRGSLLIRFANSLAGRVAGQAWLPRFLQGHGLRRRMDRLETELAGMQSARQAPLLLLSTMAIWIPSYLMFYWLLQSFGTPFSFWGTVFASTLSTVTTLLPVGTIGNFGTTEAGWTMGLVLLGATKEQALATGLSTHIVGFALAGLLGLVGAVFLGPALLGRGEKGK